MRAAIISFFVLGLCAIASTCFAQAQTSESPSSGKPYPLKYVRLYADDKGVSHFKEEQLDMPGAASRADRNAMALAGASGARLLRLKTGTVETWHKVPRRQFLFIIKGKSEVTAADGEKREFVPGDIVLMDDTTGQGHITKAIGNEDHVALFIPVD